MPSPEEIELYKLVNEFLKRNPAEGELEIAVEFGVSGSTIHKWAGGKEFPFPDLMLDVSNYLKRRIGELVISSPPTPTARVIMWLRSLFCKHSWDTTETEVAVYRRLSERERIEQLIPFEESEPRFDRMETEVSATCIKCGWHREYVKS